MADWLDFYEDASDDPRFLKAPVRPRAPGSFGTLGAVGRGAIGSAAPTAGGIAAFPLGAQAGGTIGTAIFPGPGTVIGAGIGGLGAAFAGGAAAERLQEWAFDLAPGLAAALGQDDETREADELYHPFARFVGSVLPQAAFMRPGLQGLGAASVGAGIGAGVEAGVEYQQTGTIDPSRVAVQGAAGALFGTNRRLGDLAQAPANYAVARAKALSARVPQDDGTTLAEIGAADVARAAPEGLAETRRTPEEIAARTVVEQATHARATNPFPGEPGSGALHGQKLAAATERVLAGARAPAPRLDIDAMIVRHVRDLEGGGTPVTDTGGFTRFGVSAKANPDVDIAGLDEGGAVALLRRRYWTPMRLDGLDPDLAAVAFDAAMMHGPARAKAMLRESGGSVEKLIALRREAVARLIAAKPEVYGKYKRGWENRFRRLEGWYGGGETARLTPGEAPPAREAAVEVVAEAPDGPSTASTALLGGGGATPERLWVEGMDPAKVAPGELPPSLQMLVDRAPEAQRDGVRAQMVELRAGEQASQAARTREVAALPADLRERAQAGQIEPLFNADEGDRLFALKLARANGDELTWYPEEGQLRERKARDAAGRNAKTSPDPQGARFRELIEQDAQRTARAAPPVEEEPPALELSAREDGDAAADEAIWRQAKREAEADPSPAPPRAADTADTLARFDDPQGDGAAQQIASAEHDVRVALEADPAMTVRLSEAGGDVKVADVLDAIDAEIKGVEALRACATAGAAA